MVEMLPLKSILPMECLKNNSLLIKFSNKTKCLILSELPEVTEFKVSSKDLVLNIYKKKLTEVTEESDVSEDGIQLELDFRSEELVNMVIITELKWIKKSIELEKDLNQITLLLPKIWLINKLPLWEVSLIMVRLKMISLWLKEVLLDQKKEFLL